MSELKTYQVDAFIQKKPTQAGIYLVYGSDAGLVHERSIALCASSKTPNSPSMPDNLITLDMSEIDAEPSRLAVEALTTSLFGDAPVIRVRNASKSLVPMLEELLQNPFPAFIVLEAGSMTKRDKLRVLVEESKIGWTLPSFADDDKSLNSLINQVFKDENIAIDADAVKVLCAYLGNDREVTRRELEKLINFAGEDKKLNISDIETLCGDNSTIALDELVDAVGMGQLSHLETALNKSYIAGLDSQLLLNACNRHFQFLRTIRAKIDAGANSNSALASTYPKPHFSRKNKIDHQVSRWSDKSLSRTTNRLYDATLKSRQHSGLSETITRRALLGICVAASRY